MKKIFLLITMLVFTFCSCTIYTSLRTKQTVQFKKDIMSKYKQINGLSTKFSVPIIYFNYKLKNGSSENDMINIFNSTKELVQNGDFQKDILDSYFKKYPVEKNGIKYYPDINITFDLDNNNDIEFKFTSSYYTKPTITDKNTEVDKYNTWVYWDCKKAEIRAIPQPSANPY